MKKCNMLKGRVNEAYLQAGLYLINLLYFNTEQSILIMLNQFQLQSTNQSMSQMQNVNLQILENLKTINNSIQNMAFNIQKMAFNMQNMASKIQSLASIMIKIADSHTDIKDRQIKLQASKSEKISHSPYAVLLNSNKYRNSNQNNYLQKKQISQKKIVPKSSRITYNRLQSKQRQLQETEREILRIQNNPSKAKELQRLKIKRQRVATERTFFANKIEIEQERRMEMKMKTETEYLRKMEWEEDMKTKKELQRKKDIDMAMGSQSNARKERQRQEQLRLRNQRVRRRRMGTEAIRQREY